MITERTYTDVVEKADWGDGPWNDEPDKVQWVDEQTDLDCMVKRGPMGNWCGYVGVPRSHPWYGRSYNDLDVEVHGGLTYASPCQEGVPEAEGICHVPAPGRPADVWWFGFDCGHCFDFMPGLYSRERRVGLPAQRFPQDEYRTLEYVRGETIRLARQLAVVG